MVIIIASRDNFIVIYGREAWDVCRFFFVSSYPSSFLLSFLFLFSSFPVEKSGVLGVPNLVFSLFSQEGPEFSPVMAVITDQTPAGLMNCNNSETSLQELILEFKPQAEVVDLKFWAQHKPLHFQVYLPLGDATSCLLKGKKKKAFKRLI